MSVSVTQFPTLVNPHMLKTEAELRKALFDAQDNILRMAFTQAALETSLSRMGNDIADAVEAYRSGERTRIDAVLQRMSANVSRSAALAAAQQKAY